MTELLVLAALIVQPPAIVMDGYAHFSRVTHRERIIGDLEYTRSQ